MTQTPELLPVTPLALKSLQRIAAIPSLPGIDRPLRLSPRDAAAILAALSHAIHEPASVMREEAAKVGWTLVPSTPTPEMIEAGEQARIDSTDVYFDGSEVARDVVAPIWDAMLANLPLSDGVGGQGPGAARSVAPHDAETFDAMPEADTLRRIVLDALAEYEDMDDGLGITHPDHWTHRARKRLGIGQP